MVVYKVITTEKTAGCDEVVFLETLNGIFAENPNLGFFEHPRIKTPQQLKNHLDKLKREGFKIRKTTHTARIFDF